MIKITQTNSRNNRRNARVANQFTLTSTTVVKNTQSDTWPLDKNQIQSAPETFPLSWSAYPVNGLFFG